MIARAQGELIILQYEETEIPLLHADAAKLALEIIQQVDIEIAKDVAFQIQVREQELDDDWPACMGQLPKINGEMR